MKNYLVDFARAIPLAIGTVLTLYAVVVAFGDDSDRFGVSLISGIVGIPLLFASLCHIGRAAVPEGRR